MKNLKFLIKEKLLTIVGHIYSDECKTFSQNVSFQITYHSLLSLIKKFYALSDSAYRNHFGVVTKRK